MADDTPVYDLLFEMEMNLCEVFPPMTPLTLRRERATDIYTLLVRFNRYARKKKKNEGKKKIIRRPASDSWF